MVDTLIHPDRGISGRHRLGIAVVGVGEMGRLHAKNLRSCVEGADLVRVCDLDSSAAAEAGERLGVPWSTSLADILEDKAIAGVVVAAATSAHLDLVAALARAGKHIFIEKPIALDMESTRAAVDVANEARVILQVGFQRRFDADFLALRDWATNTAGQLHFLRVAHRDMVAPPPGSYLAAKGDLLADTMIHDFDTALWLVGPVDRVVAVGAAPLDRRFAETGDCDHAAAIITFTNGALGLIDNSRATGYGFECSAELLGAAGGARVLQTQVGQLAWLSEQGCRTALPQDHAARHASAYRAELAAFVAAIRDETPSPVPAQAGIEAFALVEAARMSVSSGRPVATTAFSDGILDRAAQISEL